MLGLDLQLTLYSFGTSRNPRTAESHPGPRDGREDERRLLGDYTYVPLQHTRPNVPQLTVYRYQMGR